MYFPKLLILCCMLGKACRCEEVRGEVRERGGNSGEVRGEVRGRAGKSVEVQGITRKCKEFLRIPNDS